MVIMSGKVRWDLKIFQYDLGWIWGQIASSWCTQTSFAAIKQKLDISMRLVTSSWSIVSFLSRILGQWYTQNICFDTYTCCIAQWVNLYAFWEKEIDSPALFIFQRHLASMTRTKYFRIQILPFILKFLQPHTSYGLRFSDAFRIHFSSWTRLSVHCQFLL